MKNFLLAIAFTAILLSTVQAQVQSLVNFNNTADLTTLFNPDATPVFSNISDQGIGNTGSINVPLGSSDIWTTKSGYTVSGEGDIYTLSAFFKIKDNSGYGGLGFSANNTNEPDGYGSPVYGLGMAFHGGGGMFINNRVQTNVSWPPDLVIGNWYKMILKVTALGSNLFDMNFQIWDCDANGVLGSMKTEHSLSNVSNTQVGGATTLHVYFSAAGSRMEKIDDFEINLEGGAVIIEEGEPVLTTDAVTSITATTATCGGNITDDRGSAVTVRGVCWSTTTGSTTALSTKTSDGTGEGVFTSSLSGLAASTTYYVRAYATNGVGTSYGAEVSFTTSFGAVLPVGSGTIGDPYQIATLENLYWITAPGTVDGLTQIQRWSKYYIQTANIDASSTSTWNSSSGWSPIGITPNAFTGTYNGNGHTISGLFINRNATDYQGLFGRNVGAISNLGITDVNITGLYGTGGLVGINYGPISNSYCTGSITGDMATGGLVGANFVPATIRKSYSNASVTGGSSDYGGLVGQHRDGALIADCYSTGNVTRSSGGGAAFGGLVGIITSTSTITNSYSTGRVIYTIGGNPTNKGFIGAYTNGTLTNNFWDTETSLQTTTAGTATGKTTAEMKTNSTFLSAGWDYTIWNIGDGINNGYPYLKWQNPTGTSLTSIALPVGAGTVGDPYEIATLQNLTWIAATDVDVPSPNQATRWAAYYIQTANIDASGTSTWNTGAGWSPIGNSTIRFSGTYDGAGHTISGLYINRSSSDYQSFIGFTNTNTVIKNLGLLNVNFTGHWHVGGLVACPAFSTISKCFTTGSVSGSDNFVGGLFGYSHITNTDNCYTTASVTGTGIADYIGGAIGYLNGGTLVKSYSTGVVTGTSSNVGGLVSYGSGTVTGSFWDTQSSGKATSFLGTAKTTAEMKTNTTFLSAGWDDTIWNMDAGFNSGYPYLDWQNPGGTAMPVELTSFSATTAGSTIKLNWSTATETNNYGFEIERKVGSPQSTVGNYEKIGFVNGNGNSNSPKDYSFVDSKVNAGKYSYRLKQIDNDGQFEYSKTIEVEMNGVTKFELSQNYPNPFNPTTSIRYAIDGRQFVSLKVFNLLGKEVATLVNENKEAGNYLVNFNASYLSSGIYIYKLQAGEFIQTKKMTLIK